ncbi:hypothetical protein C8A05DRAFT_18535 [Staphylotrichum tortipilum]|uniref:2EXR domain-containing protein n=1 Tax=Staphylotrichum tortipilum TaxID=2831512 RepID=A0AAN6RQD4_9PEZI|nr:hypothetical protein C8A05DRAFT_18535 [Staphylotrichum longicolle]
MAQPQAARLFNDLYFNRLEASPAPHGATWTLFPLLPAELRLHIWLMCLRQHRLINLYLSAPDEGPTAYPGPDDLSHSRYYKDVNHRGKVISGRGYTLRMAGHRDYGAPALSPLLRVNSEARRAALGFYHIQLPFPVRATEKTLYLNAAYDVVHLCPRGAEGTRAAALLADFLHDVVAFDQKDQGVAHLALHKDFFPSPSGIHLTPSDLHPTAANSFTHILTDTLRSVLCIVLFRPNERGRAEVSRPAGWRFTQTFPLAPLASRATNAVHWLASDPRVSVAFDLGYLSLAADPGVLWRSWEGLEKAFGVAQTPAAAGGGGFKFYICPTADWVSEIGSRDGEGATEEEKGLRTLLAAYLRDENEDWRRQRRWQSAGVQFQSMSLDTSSVADAATFWRMQEVPSTAVGMWLFAPEAFNRCLDPGRCNFNVSAAKPGLLLFDV